LLDGPAITNLQACTHLIRREAHDGGSKKLYRQAYPDEVALSMLDIFRNGLGLAVHQERIEYLVESHRDKITLVGLA
jgi:hypothetical protein